MQVLFECIALHASAVATALACRLPSDTFHRAPSRAVEMRQRDFSMDVSQPCPSRFESARTNKSWRPGGNHGASCKHHYRKLALRPFGYCGQRDFVLAAMVGTSLPIRRRRKRPEERNPVGLRRRTATIIILLDDTSAVARELCSV